MLVLKRRVGQRVGIGEHITVEVRAVEAAARRCELQVDAPDGTRTLNPRSNLWLLIAPAGDLVVIETVRLGPDWVKLGFFTAPELATMREECRGEAA